MAAFGSPSSGTQGPVAPGLRVETVDLMRDARGVNTLREDFARGVGKAHRQVVYSHGEHRNFRRSGPFAAQALVR